MDLKLKGKTSGRGGGAAPSLLDFRRLTVIRQGRRVLRDVTLQLRVGEHVAILGPNGSGKSTLIKTLTRELYPLEGSPGFHFTILGHSVWNVVELRRWLGIVSPDLLAKSTREITARELVLSGFFSGIGLWPHNPVTAVMERKARRILRFLEIPHLADRLLSDMSTGEQRRALIGRALVHDPKALILDEPTHSLDPRAVQEFRTTLRKVAHQGHSIILVTHQLHDIIPEIDRVILLKRGRIVAEGPKSRVLTSRGLSRLFGLPMQVVRRKGYFTDSIR